MALPIDPTPPTYPDDPLAPPPPAFPTVGVDPDGLRQLSQADLLALADRVLPGDYVAGLRGGQGYEVLEAFAAALARVSTAVARFEHDAVIMYSSGATFALVSVQFYRDAAGPDVTQKAGTIVKTTTGGRAFATLTDAVFTGGATGPVTVQALALFADYGWNVPGQRTTADGTVLPGDIDAIERSVQDPAFGEPLMRVRNVADATGGSPPMLDAHGADRGIFRAPAEADGPYRLRVRTLPDTISPDAIVRALHKLFDGSAIAFKFIETFDPRYQMCFDCPPEADLPDPHVSGDLFVYDADGGPTFFPVQNRWLGFEDYRGAFVVVVATTTSVLEIGFVWDDTAVTEADYTTPGGSYGIGAYDLLPGDVLGANPGCYDGSDVGADGYYAAAWDMLQAIKAAGVFVAFELAGN